MGASLGRVTAWLVDAADSKLPSDMVALINKNINPPEEIGEADVYVRAMYVASDEVNSFGGRFPAEELPRLAELLVDAPVMVGHRKDKLPVGRSFHATVVERKGKTLVKSYFYWLKSADGSESLRENIDGGVYKECSIGFTFLFPECSICRKDIRTCEHEPFREYPADRGVSGAGGSDTRGTCYYNYRRIERVLETSLVYRGAVPDTAVSKDLHLGAGGNALKVSIPVVTHPGGLKGDQEYLVVPYYESVPVYLSSKGGVLDVRRADGRALGRDLVSLFDGAGTIGFDKAYGYLVGYRGKERCSMTQLENYLAGQSSPIRRVEIKLLPDEGLDARCVGTWKGRHSIVMIRFAVADANTLDRVSRRIMTRQGVRLWPVGQNPATSQGQRYLPGRREDEVADTYSLTYRKDRTHATLGLEAHGRKRRFVIRQLNLSRLMRGGRFIADEISVKDVCAEVVRDEGTTGNLLELTESDGSCLMKLSGPLTGRFMVKAIRLDGQERHLFYRLTA